jgi:precorrin-6A/cobalt-precorrin-6A reductase
VEAHKAAKQAAQNARIPYLHWLREESDLTGFPNLHQATDHQAAAQMAVAFRQPILLTVGSRNVAPYATAARAANLPIYARVLPCQESEESCRLAGLHDAEVIAARGPFTAEDTFELLCSLKIGTLVTKESGNSGGVPEKLEAATRANCNVVIVQRAAFEEPNLCHTLDELITMLTAKTK